MRIKCDFHSFNRIATVCVALIIIDQEALAIPPFARKYKTSCQTCHFVFPKLNSFGEAFRLNGYQIPNAEDALVKDEPLELGAAPWKQMWPRAIWPSDLPAMPPIGLRINNDTRFSRRRGASPSSDFEFPHEIELLAGGRLGEKVGFFGELAWEQEGELEAEQAYLIANGLLSSFLPLPAETLNARIGLFDMQMLFAYNKTTRLGRVEPLWGNKRASDVTIGGLTSLNDFRLQNNQPGVELNGIFMRRFYWGAGIVTGNGQEAEDNNNHKDVYYKLKWKLLGRDFLGRLGDQEVSLDPSPGNWRRQKEVLIEHFGYFGQGAAQGGRKDNFRYFGGAVRGTYRDLDMSFGYVLGSHDEPFGIDSPAGLRMNTWFAKAEHMVFPWMMLRGVYEGLDYDAGTPLSIGRSTQDQRRVLLGPVFAPLANIAVEIEWEQYLESSSSPPDSLWIRLDWAF